MSMSGLIEDANRANLAKRGNFLFIFYFIYFNFNFFTSFIDISSYEKEQN